jgi:hypothetical protein
MMECSEKEMRMKALKRLITEMDGMEKDDDEMEEKPSLVAESDESEVEESGDSPVEKADVLASSDKEEGEDESEGAGELSLEEIKELLQAKNSSPKKEGMMVMSVRASRPSKGKSKRA